MNIKTTKELIEFLQYKKSLRKILNSITEEQYIENPVGFEVYGYIDKLLDLYNDREMDFILDNQDKLIKKYV